MDKKFLFLGALIACALTGCLDSPGDANSSTNEKAEGPIDVEAEMEKAKKRAEGLEKRLAGLQGMYERATGVSEIESSTDAEPEGDAAPYLDKLKQADAYFTSELELWRNATRKSFEGIKIPNLETESGESFSQAVIRKVGDERLDIDHTGGSASIEISDLPEKLRTNLIHEPTVLDSVGR